MTFIFGLGYVYHWSTVYGIGRDKSTEDRVYPEAFTLKSKVAQDMWDHSLESYNEQDNVS